MLLSTTLRDSILNTRKVGVTPNRSLICTNAIRLVGTAFDGDTIDTNFWTKSRTGTGDVAINGEAELATGTTADSTVSLTSVRKGRFVVSNPMEFKSVCEWHTTAGADNVRRIGVYDDENGFFFQMNGTTFQVGYRYTATGTTSVLISSGSFNGDVTTFDPSTTRHKISIQYTNKSVYWFIDGQLLHSVSLTHSIAQGTMTFPIAIENNNSNGNTTDHSFHIIGAVINRLGNVATNPTSYFQSGTTTGTVIKRTAGLIRGIVISNVANNSDVTLYNGVTVAGDEIWSSGAMGSQTQPFSIDFFGLPFDDGLTLEIADAGCNVTIIYE